MSDDTLPSLPGNVADPCAEPAKTIAMVPVEQSGASSSSCSPSVSGGASCPDNAAPFWSRVDQASLVIPEVGGSFTVKVCDPDIWAVGQWVFIPGLGRFPITEIGISTITLRNSCEDASAIPGNLAPGTTLSSLNTQIWPIDALCDEGSDCQAFLDCLEAASVIRLTNVPKQSPEETVSIMGLTAEDPCGGENTNALRCIGNIYSNYYTFGFKDLPDTGDGDISFAAFETGDVCAPDDVNVLKRLATPATDGIYKVCGGKVTYVEKGRVFIPEFKILRRDDAGYDTINGQLFTHTSIPQGVGTSFNHGTITLDEPDTVCGEICYKLYVSIVAACSLSNNGFGFKMQIGGIPIFDFWITNAFATNDNDWSSESVEVDVCFPSSGNKDVVFEDVIIGTGATGDINRFTIIQKGHYA